MRRRSLRISLASALQGPPPCPWYDKSPLQKLTLHTTSMWHEQGTQAECVSCTAAAHAQVADIAKLGLAVTATFAIMWAPFLGRTSDFLQVLHRIVPVRRGLYEDYVANFWCTTSLAIKWRSLFSQQVSLCLLDI